MSLLSFLKSTKTLKLLTVLAVALTFFQTSMLTGFPVDDPKLMATISAIVMFSVLAVTALKQFVSALINNAALIPTLIVLGVAIVGGIADMADQLPFSESAAKWIRWIITLLMGLFNVLSAVLFPSQEQKNLNFQKNNSNE